jgi:TetR/AcrR family transcriptional regulator, transcriptional repressor for nem operon
MRVSREKAAENRKRIVETASRMFRQEGFDRAGIDAIMKAAGLTHGGFYCHFGSKEDLAAEAVISALARSLEKQGRHKTLSGLVRGYLSEQHCANRTNGCALAALGGDIARQSKAVRSGVTDYIHAQLSQLVSLIRGGTAASRRRRAITALSGMVGALTIARAVEDPALSSEILETARDVFGGRSRNMHAKGGRPSFWKNAGPP